MSNETTLGAELQERIKKAGKHAMQIMVLQCQSLYSTGMTESAFIEAVYGDIAAINRTAEGVNLFKQVYAHLSASQDIAETGETVLAVYLKALTNTSTDCQVQASSAFVSGSTGIETLTVPVIIIAALIIAILIASSTPAY